jgi:hypothetical protein
MDHNAESVELAGMRFGQASPIHPQRLSLAFARLPAELSIFACA